MTPKSSIKKDIFKELRVTFRNFSQIFISEAFFVGNHFVTEVHLRAHASKKSDFDSHDSTRSQIYPKLRLVAFRLTSAQLVGAKDSAAARSYCFMMMANCQEDKL